MPQRLTRFFFRGLSTSTIIPIILLTISSINAFTQQNRGAQMSPFDEGGEKKNVRALIVGVSSYPKLPTNSQLSYAHSDALMFRNFLLAKPWFISPENIMLYINEEASNKEVIKNKFYSLLKESEKGDLVIFFFAGHGDIQNTFGEDLGFLLLNGVKEPKIEDYYVSNDAIRIKELQEIVSMVAGNNGIKVLLIIDACHSGKIVSSNENSEKVLSSLSQEWRNAYKMVSSQANQFSQEDIRWGGGHGVFSWYLINGAKGLADTDNDLIVDFYELEEYVKSNVTRETKRLQIPTFSGLSTQKLFFVDEKLKEQALASITSNFDAPLSPQPKTQQFSQVVNGSEPTKRSTQNFFNLTPEDEYQVQKFDELLLRGDILPQYTVDNSPKDVVKNLKVNNVFVKDGHQKNTYCIAFDKSGNLIATGGEDGKIMVWDNKTLSKKAELDHSGVLSLVFSMDNRFLISGGWNQEIKIWDASTFDLIKSFNAHNDDIRCMAIDPSGRYLASGGDDLTIKIWEVESGKQIASLSPKHKKRITSLRFTGKSNHIISAGKDGLLLKWNFENGQIVSQIDLRKPINSIDISLNNNNLIVGCDDGYLGVYNSTNLEKIKDIDVGLDNINALAIDNDANYMIAGGKTRKLIVYDNHNENKIIFETSLPRGITNIDFTATGDALGVSLHGGQWAKLDVTIPSKNTPANALNLYELLIAKPSMQHYITRLNDHLVSTIFSRAFAVLDPFLTGASSLPGAKEIEIAKAEIQKLKEIVGDDAYFQERIKIYNLLLDICESYTGAEFSELPKAISKIEALIKELPDASFTYNIMSSFYQKLRKLEEAKKAIGVASKNIPDWVEPKLSLAYTYFLERKYDSASYINEKVITSAPSFAKAYIQQANLQNFLADFYQADENYKKGISLDSLSADNFCNYARLYLKMGDTENAKKMVEKAIRIDSKYFLSYLLNAEIYHFEFQNSPNKKTFASQLLALNAYDNYLKSLNLSPSNAEVKARFANFLVTVVNNPELIDKSLNDILPEEKGNKKLKLKQYALVRRAKKYYSEALKSDPYLFFAYYGMLNAEVFLNDKKAINQIINELKALSVKNPKANYYISKYYTDINKKKKAFKYIKAAIKSDKNDISYYLLNLKLNDIKTQKDAVRFLSSNYNSMFVSSFSNNLVDYEFFYY